MATSRQQWAYDLEQLYEDHEPGLALEAIPHLLCWLDPKERQSSHRFELREQTRKGPVDHELQVSWDVVRLAERDPRLRMDLARFRSGITFSREHRTELAAYGLALVATSCILRRRVIGVSYFRTPDLLLDTTPGALCGIEVAGRTSKGYTALAQALDGAPGKPGKRAQLRTRAGIIEAYISLWCSEPMVSIWEKVKP
jgi:hypothetical protein